MMDLAEFLLAVTDAIETATRANPPHEGDCDAFNYNPFCSCDLADDILAECEAKRLILELHKSGDAACDYCRGWSVEDGDPAASCPTLRLLAVPYANYEAYREEWRP